MRDREKIVWEVHMNSTHRTKTLVNTTQVAKSDISLARSDENRKATLPYQFVLYDSYKILPNYNIRIKSYDFMTEMNYKIIQNLQL